MQNIIPVSFNFNIKPVEVSWLEIQDSRFSDPMFDDSMKKLRLLGKKVTKTGLDSLFTKASSEPGVYPKGFIFHVGRCGSTILSNALQQINSTTVISEPSTINTLLQFPLLNNFADIKDESNVYEILKPLILIYSGIENRDCFIKFTSWNSLFIHHLTKMFPETPIIFAFRDPFQVFNSILAKPVGWMQYYGKLMEDDYEQKSFIHFVITALKHIYTAGLGLNEKAILINYSNKKEDNINQMLQHFNLQPGREELENITHFSNFYSKDPNRSILFTNKKNLNFKLTEAVSHMINEDIIPIYESLVKLSDSKLNR